ncbi:hypothetical protein HMPREF9166_1406 [Selenomonas sp. oral taxon 149 str. 67H29BP]|nr:hypothetical protein HMPREF9166_1406 [Selenomonas sp. oral taxon 149 str. 67H29BP]
MRIADPFGTSLDQRFPGGVLLTRGTAAARTTLFILSQACD